MAEMVLERVVNLEGLLADFIVITKKSILDSNQAIADTQLVLAETNRAVAQSSKNLDILALEMRDFKVEMHYFKNEMVEFKNEMVEFKNEMVEFKNEMLEFKEESRRESKEMKKQWGDLANKMGTIVEDLIVPAVRPMIRKYFGEEFISLAPRIQKFDKKTNTKGEFDVIATTTTRVFLIETKSSPSKEHLKNFKQKVIPRFRQLFPEFNHLKLVPIFATVSFDDKFLPVASAEGIYLMAYREWEFMDLLNFEDVKTPFDVAA